MFKTYSFNIRENSDKSSYDDIIYRYTGMYFKLFNNVDSLDDKDFIAENRDKYNFSRDMYNSCCEDVKMMHKSAAEIKQEKEEKIKEINEWFDEYDKKPSHTKKQKHHRRKLIKTKEFLIRTKDNGICFGGKHILRQITELHNKIRNTQDKTEIYKLDGRLRNLKSTYKSNRERTIFIVGRANDDGNRHVDFHLDENYIIFKFDKNTHVRLDLTQMHGSERQQTILKLQELAVNKDIPITVRLGRHKVHISFDTEIVYGYGFDTKAFNIAVKDNPELDKATIRQEFFKEQESRKLDGKIVNRVAGFDLNPAELGFSIVDVDENGEVVNIVFHHAYHVGFYVNKKKMSRRDRNKYYYELAMCVKDAFKHCVHYKVSMVSVEELKKITTKDLKSNSKYFNRITKNNWNRKLQIELINSYCSKYGILYREVEAYYSSFIGNMMYKIYDCCAAAVELARRGYLKFNKNCKNRVYPRISNDVYQYMCYLVGCEITKPSWMKCLKIFKMFDSVLNEGWWRNKNFTEGKYLNTKKSNVVFRY